MSLTLKRITDAIKEPARKVFNGDVKTLFVDNPAAMRLSTYGSRVITGTSPAHDHSDDGGELIKGTLLSLQLGPYLREGAGVSSFQAGIPLIRNSGLLGSPKLLMPALLTVPGGVTRLRGAMVVFCQAASGSTTLTPVLRGVNWHNFKLVTGTLGVSATIDLNWTCNGDNYYLLEWSWGATSLAKVKNLNVSARCEFLIYQKGQNFGASRAHILATELWVDDAPSVAVRGPSPSDPPLSQITFSDILSGKILLTQLSRKLRGALNAGILSVLGRAPGLAPDGVALDNATRWARPAKTAHSHRGKLVPTGRGDFVADGVCLRYPPRATAVWPRNWGEDATGLRNADTSQVRGLKIHSSGALDATWLSWDFDIDLESGLGALEAMVSVEPGNSVDAAKLMIHVGVFAIGGSTNLAKTVRCDYHNQESVDGDGLLVCEVEPEENDAWQPNQSRRLAGKGVFTRLAKKAAAQASTLVQTTNAYRVSKPILIGVSHPAYQSDGEARATGKYVLRVRLSLETGATYDADARVLAWDATASKGY